MGRMFGFIKGVKGKWWFLSIADDTGGRFGGCSFLGFFFFLAGRRKRLSAGAGSRVAGRALLRVPPPARLAAGSGSTLAARGSRWSDEGLGAAALPDRGAPRRAAAEPRAVRAAGAGRRSGGGGGAVRGARGEAAPADATGGLWRGGGGDVGFLGGCLELAFGVVFWEEATSWRMSVTPPPAPPQCSRGFFAGA